MSYIYTITETEKQNLPDGQYIEEITSIEEKMYSYQDNMITYVEVKWEVHFPDEYKGREEIEKFYIAHSDPIKASKAKRKFSELCKQMTGMKTGEALNTGSIIGKKALVTVKNNVSDKDGKLYQNILNRVLLPSKELNSGIQSQAKEGSLTYGGLKIPQEIPQVTKDTAAILKMAGIQVPEAPTASSTVFNDDLSF